MIEDVAEFRSQFMTAKLKVHQLLEENQHYSQAPLGMIASYFGNFI